MSIKRILGILICIAGVVLILISNNIKGQIAEGNLKISNAESQVNQGQSLFGLNPITKEIGQRAVIDPAQQKINAGKAEVAEYTILANRLMIGGIILCVVGFGIAVIPFGMKKG